MRALLIVRNPSMPDIVFLSADKAFIQHLNKAAIEKGLMMEDELEDERLDISVATQFFSPIIASQGAMTNELHTPYQSITCENDFVLVLRQFGEHLYIAMNGSGQESEEFLQRKLLVFNRLITFYYGPVVEQMSPRSISERQIIWQELDNVLNAWADLYNKEQSFLVEALERLQVNQTVNEMCITLLENVLHKLKGAGDKNAVHAMVIVHAKLLALYSSRRASELQSSDLLLITLLAHSFFPTTDNVDELEALMKADPPAKRVHRRLDSNQAGSNSEGEYVSAGEEGSESSYYSPDETDEPTEIALLESGTLDDQDSLPFEASKLDINPALSSSSHSEGESEEEEEEDKHRSLDLNMTPTTNDQFHTPPTGTLKRPGRDALDGAAMAIASSPPLAMSSPPTFTDPRYETYMKSARFIQRASIAPSDVGSSGERRACVRMPAFLQLVSCNCAPHTLYFAPILPGITLVVLSEMRVQLAKVISQCLFLLDLINRKQSAGADIGTSGRNIEESLDGLIKQVCEHAKRLKHPSLNERQKSLTEQWELVKQCGLQKYIDGVSGRYMSPRLESALPELTRLLKKIFEIRYLGNRTASRKLPEKIGSAIYDLQQMLQENLCHYEQYLAVKAQRNITMTTYLEDFPGLVHFIHVDRKTDQLTAPSINMTSQTSNDTTKASILLRDQVWHMVHQMHGFLQQGYFTAAMRRGDFYYSYFLYFEDMAGKLLVIHKPLKTERTHGLPGILTGNFFKEIVQRCFPNAQPGSVRCCELICLHLSVVPLQYVASHARRLCRSLWETSGEAATPVNLL